MDIAFNNETRVAVAGDWHANVNWVQKVIPRLTRQYPDVCTILHVGDFGFWPGRQGRSFLGAVDYWCKSAGIARVLVTPGNHEDWAALDEVFAKTPGQAVQMSETVWALPRTHRFELAGRSFLSFGGAASIDYADRVPGKSWWPTELPTEADVTAAIAGGPVDVIIAHETVNGGTPATEKVLRSNPMSWSEEERAYSARSRDMVTRVWDTLAPKLLAHGHMHTSDDVELADGRRVYSLGCDNQANNLGLLTLSDLSWHWPDRSEPFARRVPKTRNLENLYLTRPDGIEAGA